MVLKKTKLFLHLKKWLEKCSMDYNMIEPGDRILVGVSGGADSLALLDLLNTGMLFIPNDFSLLAVNIDLGFDQGDGRLALDRYLREQGYQYIIDQSDIGPLAHSDFNKKNPCFLCSRLRRKRMFEIAAENGCNKVALAHHRDDLIETLLINVFYGREISTMVPNQSIFEGRMNIIRPLAYIREELVKKYAREQELPAIKNECPTSRTSKRAEIKKLLSELEKDNTKVRDNIFRSMYHVKPDYMPGAGKIKKSE
jgi:tRNA 2-thiocytidine biosynthesis protein TtcA